mgnify:CR=1 FL=1|tara:strand:- start:6323 stop:7585 length:1263 start_codon:yes stop_codon:yes gene_type:complete
MPQNWKTHKLGEVANIGSSKRIFRADYVSSGIPFYRSKEIIQKSFGDAINDILYISPDKYFSIKKKYGAPITGDVLLSAVGNRSGIPYLVNDDGEFYFKDGNLMWLRDFKLSIDSSFLVYWFKSAVGQHYLNSLMIGSAQKALTIEGVKTISINLPPLPEQKAIANILSAIDAKIENNLAINKTLEEMAMAFYKEWFVDFVPFQDGKFIESELGMIPEGWEVKRLEEILEIKRGGSPRPIKDFISDSGLPWLKISDATAANSPFQYSTKEYIKPEGLRKTVLIKPGAIILSNSATPGLPRLIEFETCIHDGWLHFPEIKRFNRYFLYLLFLDIKEHLISQGNGSVFTNLKTDILKSQNVKIPPLKIEEQFLNKINSKFEKIRENTVEIQTLTQLRDTLLPKLVSGEVRLNEFDLEEVLEN